MKEASSASAGGPRGRAPRVGEARGLQPPGQAGGRADSTRARALSRMAARRARLNYRPAVATAISPPVLKRPSRELVGPKRASFDHPSNNVDPQPRRSVRQLSKDRPGPRGCVEAVMCRVHRGWFASLAASTKTSPRVTRTLFHIGTRGCKLGIGVYEHAVDTRSWPAPTPQDARCQSAPARVPSFSCPFSDFQRRSPCDQPGRGVLRRSLQRKPSGTGQQAADRPLDFEQFSWPPRFSLDRPKFVTVPPPC